MVVGMLLAGGTGERVGYGIPKQFITVNGKPIILYPLEVLEKHSQIDAIEIVCVESYIETMWDIVKQSNLKKVKWIVSGGDSCQTSTRNGLNNLKPYVDDDDIVLIHMASYPLASIELLSDCIISAINNGNGCTAKPILYSVYCTDDRRTSSKQIDRDKLMLCSAPYAFRFGECSELYDRAFAEGKGIKGNVYTNTLYCDYGKTIYFVNDSPTNIKITTSEDLIIMETFVKNGLV